MAYQKRSMGIVENKKSYFVRVFAIILDRTVPILFLHFLWKIMFLSGRPATFFIISTLLNLFWSNFWVLHESSKLKSILGRGLNLSLDPGSSLDHHFKRKEKPFLFCKDKWRKKMRILLFHLLDFHYKWVKLLQERKTVALRFSWSSSLNEEITEL